jgi:IS5 family transposase
MFRLTNPQTTMFESQYLMPEEKAARLKRSWAEPFRTRVLGLIDEELFRDAFAENNGRPNRSIRLMVGLHLLKEWNDLTDEQVLDQLEYNLQWHHALGVEPATAHGCQKTLHNFRVLLCQNDRAQWMLADITRRLAEMDGLQLGHQRLDSTHIVSNIALLTRLGLFVETVTVFLKKLRNEQPAALAALPAGFARRYLEREGYFSDAKREQVPRRLVVVAQDLWTLVQRFSGEPVISRLPAYLTLNRLFTEQCEVVASADAADVAADAAEAPVGSPSPVRLRDPKTIGGESLQSPHDLDATYGRKGKGYEVQLAETCDASNPYQVITGAAITAANASDQHAVVPMLEQFEETGLGPDTLSADTGYGSGANIVACAKRGVDLQAPVQDPAAPQKFDPFAAPIDPAGPAAADGATADGATADGATADGATADGATADGATADDNALTMGHFTCDVTYSQILACPAGHAPTRQHQAEDLLIADFAAADCRSCPRAASCPTRVLASGDRQLRRAPATLATAQRQVEQQQASFKERYRIRSGIESTNRELKHRHGLAKLRVRGEPKVDVAVFLKVLALNVKRAVVYHVSRLLTPALNPCPS